MWTGPFIFLFLSLEKIIDFDFFIPPLLDLIFDINNLLGLLRWRDTDWLVSLARRVIPDVRQGSVLLQRVQGPLAEPVTINKTTLYSASRLTLSIITYLLVIKLLSVEDYTCEYIEVYQRCNVLAYEVRVLN